MNNKQIYFISKLAVESHLSLRESENAVKQIPLNLLDIAIEIYKKEYILGLSRFIQLIKTQ